MELLLAIFVMLVGMTIGSFLNVVIYRLPLGISVVHPRSKCPGCQKLIRWYQNIPVLSYLFLHGKCEKCGYKIPIRYPAIELFTGVMALYIFDINDLMTTVFFFSIACILLCIFFIDLDHKLIPDKLNLYLLALILAHSIIFKELYYWVTGGVIGFFAPLAVTWAFYKLRNQVGLGGGDIKLFGILGLYLGPMGIMANIFMSSFLGAVVGLILIGLKRFDSKNTLAFGPYIVVIAALQIFFPDIFARINPFAF